MVSLESYTLFKSHLSQTEEYLNQWHSGDDQNINYAVLCQYLQVTQATNQIVMNCADIDIITASFAPQGGEGKGSDFVSLFSSFLLYELCYE